MTEATQPLRFARSAVSNTLLTAVLAVVGLVTTPFLTSHLGPERFGVWILVGSTLAYLELLDLGFGGAVVSFIARFSASGEQDSLMRTISTSFYVLAALGLLAFGVMAGVAQFLPHVVHLRGSLAGTARNLLLLMGFDAAVSIPMDTFGCGLVALQRFDLLNASLIAGNVAQAVAWIAVLLAGGGLLPLAAVTVGISLVGQVTRYVILRRLMPGLTVSTRLVDREVVRLLARPAGWFALGSSVDGLRDYVSVLVLGVVRNVATAGLYAVGEKLALLASKFGTAVADPYFPHAASLVGSGEGHRLKHAAPSGSRVAAGVIMPLCLVVALFSRPALNAWAGHFYERAAPAVIVLAVAASMASFDVVPFKLVSGAGGQRLLSLMGLAEAGVAVVLTAVLGSFFGLVGVAVAGLVTVVGVEIGVTLPIVCRRLDVRVRDLVLPIARAHVLPVVVCGVVGGFVAAGPVMSYVQMHGRLANLAVVAVTAAAVLVLYAAVFVVTGLDREARRAVAARVSLAGHRARP